MTIKCFVVKCDAMYWDWAAGILVVDLRPTCLYLKRASANKIIHQRLNMKAWADAEVHEAVISEID